MTASTTLNCTYDQFKRLSKDFFDGLKTATTEEEVEQGLKCLGLAYLGIQWDETSSTLICDREVGAPSVLRLAQKHAILRQVEIVQSLPAGSLKLH